MTIRIATLATATRAALVSAVSIASVAALAMPHLAHADAVPAPDVVGGLRRAVALGVAFESVGGRPVVSAVVPGSAAEKIGLRRSDTIRSVDGRPVDTARAVIVAVGAKRAGDSIALVARRSDMMLDLEGKLATVPLEHQADYDVDYGSVAVDGAKRRVIVTRPRGEGRRPAVLLVGGIGCYSLDGILRPKELRDPYARIIDGLTRAGYVTMRVEKTGMGDSEGIACSDPRADFDAEVRGYRAGLEQLEANEAVDRRRVALFAHSIGPIVAAKLVADHPVRALVVAETVGTSWYEYMVTNSRRQLVLSGMPYDEVEQRIRDDARCLHRFYVDGRSVEDIVAATPGCAEALQAPAPASYMRQVGALDLAAQWKKIDAPALLLYGTADYVTDPYQHEYLRDMINAFHPGNARYEVIDGMDHGFRITGTQAAARAGRPDAPFAQRVLDETLSFFNEKVRG